MKRWKYKRIIAGVALLSVMNLNGCDMVMDTVDYAGSESVMLPPFDIGFMQAVMESTDRRKLEVNLTEEQGAELFNQIVFCGTRLRFPMNIKDLPEYFSVELKETAEDRFRGVYKGDVYYDKFAMDGYIEETKDERFHECPRMSAIFVTDQAETYLVGVDMQSSVFDGNTLEIDSVKLGTRVPDEFYEKYGEGTIYTVGIPLVVRRVYYDGEQVLILEYMGIDYDECKDMTEEEVSAYLKDFPVTFVSAGPIVGPIYYSVK